MKFVKFKNAVKVYITVVEILCIFFLKHGSSGMYFLNFQSHRSLTFIQFEAPSLLNRMFFLCWYIGFPCFVYMYSHI